MTCEDLVAQCFLDEHPPLAVPELNTSDALFVSILQYLDWQYTLVWCRKQR